MITLSDYEKNNLRKWAVFLRETSLPQGQNALSRNGYYCCLGIWAESTLGPERWTEVSYFSSDKSDSTVYREKAVDGSWDTLLPPDVGAELGLSHEIAGMQLRKYFWIMNDLLNLSFSEIAEHITFLLEHGSFSDMLIQQALRAYDDKGKVPSSHDSKG